MPRVRNRSATGKMCCWSEKHQVFGVAPPRLATSFWVDMRAKARRVFGGQRFIDGALGRLLPCQRKLEQTMSAVQAVVVFVVVYLVFQKHQPANSTARRDQCSSISRQAFESLRCRPIMEGQIPPPDNYIRLLQAQSFPKERKNTSRAKLRASLGFVGGLNLGLNCLHNLTLKKPK